VTKSGHSAIVSTTGNENCHIVLRGGNGESILDAASIEAVCKVIAGSGLCQCDPSGCRRHSRIIGVMVESDVMAGRHNIVSGKEPAGGRSVFDDSLSWSESQGVLQELANAVTQRRLMGDRAD